MRLVILLLTALAVAVIGLAFGWRWVIAPAIVYAVVRWATASLRALAKDADELAREGMHPAPVSPGERTLFWCEECETEVLLLVRGSTRAPSHCGQRMHERTELHND